MQFARSIQQFTVSRGNLQHSTTPQIRKQNDQPESHPSDGRLPGYAPRLVPRPIPNRRLMVHILGIGDAIVNTLLTSSSSACILATARTTSALSALSWQYPDRVAAVEGNMTDPTLPQRAVDTAMQRWGRLDGLVVNHAVVEPVARIGDAVVEEWKAAFDVNVFSVIALVRRCLLV